MKILLLILLTISLTACSSTYVMKNCSKAENREEYICTKLGMWE